MYKNNIIKGKYTPIYLFHVNYTINYHSMYFAKVNFLLLNVKTSIMYMYIILRGGRILYSNVKQK